MSSSSNPLDFLLKLFAPAYYNEKQRQSQQMSADEWADSLVKSVWRPVTLGLVIGVPVVYLITTYLIGKRYPTAGHIPPEAILSKKIIRGRVTAVGDSDNFRLYHTPGWGWGWFRFIPNNRKELKNQTIPIRIAGVDAPEGAHFGMPSQPYSAEAKAFLTKMILGKDVRVQLLSRDQYSRIVAMAYVRQPPLYRYKNVSVEMVKEGLASLYVSKGAEYGTHLSEIKNALAKAKKQKKGIWSLKKYVSPEDHKSK
ncbi:hypothetical protein BDF14DRAFT_1764762 [Spinellus fusiger]|nr:hypothetical protein BDF14DRAFT_1764762 [Spinellus fusiger]